MPPRIDVKLERIGESEEAASSVKAGDRVELRTEADGSLTCTSSGGALGSVPAADAAQLAAAPYTGTIRTVRRQPGTNNVVELIVRFVSGPVAPRPPAPRLERPTDEEDTVACLTTPQLELLVANEEVRWYLRDERLQAVLRNIDGAGNREAALAAALQSPNFKEFADKVLAVAAPEPPA